MTIKLLIQSYDKRATITIINKEYLIGRSRKSDIILADSQISATHCKLWMESNSRIFIEDLDSTNGTHVNGSRVGRCRFYIGDNLQLGNISISIDTAKLSPKEYRAFFNKDRTKIGFIAPKIATQQIDRGFQDIAPAPSLQKANNIVVNFDTPSDDPPALPEIPKPSVKNKSEEVELKSDENASFNFEAEGRRFEKPLNNEKKVVEEKLDLDLETEYQSSGQTRFLKLGDKDKEKQPVKKIKKKEAEEKKSFFKNIFSKNKK